MSEFYVKYPLNGRDEYADAKGKTSLTKVLMTLEQALYASEACIYMADVYRNRDDALVDYWGMGITGNVISLIQAVKQG